MRPAAVAALLLWVAVTNAGFAQTPVAWKLKKGDVFIVHHTRQTEQRLSTGDDLTRIERKTGSVSKFRVLSDTDGKLVLEQSIESVSVGSGPENPGMKEVLSRSAGATMTYHLDSQHRITKMDNYDIFVNRLAKDDAGLQTTVRALLPEGDLRAGVDRLFDFLPPEPLAKGATWESSAAEALGPFGTLQIKSSWRLDDGPAKAERTRLSASQKIVLDTAQAAKSLPFRIKAGAVKKANSRVDVIFDAAHGHLKQRTLKRQLIVHLLVEKDKRTLDVRIEQDVSESVDVRFAAN